MNHSQWKTRRTRALLGETVEESPAYSEAGYAFAPRPRPDDTPGEGHSTAA
jgi:hypothetical protein